MKWGSFLVLWVGKVVFPWFGALGLADTLKFIGSRELHAVPRHGNW